MGVDFILRSLRVLERSPRGIARINPAELSLCLAQPQQHGRHWSSVNTHKQCTQQYNSQRHCAAFEVNIPHQTCTNLTSKFLKNKKLIFFTCRKRYFVISQLNTINSDYSAWFTSGLQTKSGQRLSMASSGVPNDLCDICWWLAMPRRRHPSTITKSAHSNTHTHILPKNASRECRQPNNGKHATALMKTSNFQLVWRARWQPMINLTSREGSHTPQYFHTFSTRAR